MKLKHSGRKFWMQVALEKAKGHRIWPFLSILGYTIIVFALGTYVHKIDLVDNTKSAVSQYANLTLKIITGQLSQPEHITIDIKHDDFMKLAYKREVALANGIMLASADDFVPAKIRYKDETIKVKLRLKGDLSDHWDGEKWSFRIVVKDDNTLFGMKQFSIQHPQTRRYLNEWFYHQTLRREGVLGLRYEFINVTINGKGMGIYALEEHFEKRLVEHNERREGPIIRFNEDLLWAELFEQSHLSIWDRTVANGSGSFLSSDIDAFQTSRWLADPTSYTQYLTAVHLLESFQQGRLTTSQVFDTEKLAKFFALTDLLGTPHGATVWTNIRYYYNPVTSRLEPIGYDGNDRERNRLESLIATRPGLRNLEQNEDDYYISTYFEDINFYRQYLYELEKISQASYVDNLFADLNDDIEKNVGIIYREFPKYQFHKDVIYTNQKHIKNILNPSKGLHAFTYEMTNNYIDLNLGSIQYLPVQILNVSSGDIIFSPVEEIILPGKYPSKPMSYQRVRFTLPEGIIWSDAILTNLTINYKILGTTPLRTASIFPWPHAEDNFVINDFIRQPPNAHDFDFLIIDEAGKKILIQPGTWELDNSLIIPNGYQVIATEGTTINLSNNATILSYSPINFIGSEDNPIVIQSLDSTGQGLVVMSTQRPSTLKHVTFNNLSNPSQNGWILTGAVTFYEAPVDISHTQFLNNKSEDALNIIRSDFTIQKTHFLEIFSDALDADFAQGEITNSSFVNSGNDAIDVSGTSINVKDIIINGAGDKGLSAGENSQITATDVTIKDASIAVASKDLSNITIHHITISNGDIGFTAYQKKAEFGSASIDATDSELSGTELPYLVEENSVVVVNGVEIEASQENVKDILYGVEYGKSSN